MESSKLSRMLKIESSPNLKNGRVPTGIEGFDNLIEGGIPRGYLLLVADTCRFRQNSLCSSVPVSWIIEV